MISSPGTGQNEGSPIVHPDSTTTELNGPAQLTFRCFSPTDPRCRYGERRFILAGSPASSLTNSRVVTILSLRRMGKSSRFPRKTCGDLALRRQCRLFVNFCELKLQRFRLRRTSVMCLSRYLRVCCITRHDLVYGIDPIGSRLGDSQNRNGRRLLLRDLSNFSCHVCYPGRRATHSRT